MKVGMLFPGYGSQYVGMAKDLYDNSRVIQEHFEIASHCLDINFVKLCYASSDVEISKISHAYPALFLVSSSVAAMVKDLGIKIDYIAGHGIGEYGALCTADGLSFPDGLYLLMKLGQFYTNMREDLDLKSVLVNGMATQKLEQICKEESSSDCYAHIAVYENKNAHIVTGHTEAVEAVAESASSATGARKVREADAIEGYHSPVLADLATQLKIYLTQVDFKDLSIPLITGLTGKELCKAKKAQDSIIGQISKPIHWPDVLKQFSDADVILIPAPSKMLVAEVKAFYPDKQVIGIETRADIDQLVALFNCTPPVWCGDVDIEESTHPMVIK